MKHDAFRPFDMRLGYFLTAGIMMSVSACGGVEAPTSSDEVMASTALEVKGRPGRAKASGAPIDSLIYNPAGKLTANGGSVGDEFGVDIALSGDFAFVGACGDDVNGLYSGSVAVFERSGGVYTQIQTLVPKDPSAQDIFGLDLATSGDTLIVGANGHSKSPLIRYSGAAYIFVRNGSVWTEQAKLVASDEKADAAFGYTVALSGDTALVGAVWDDAKGFHSGAAYVFTRNAGVWTEQQKLVAADGAAQDEFSASLALDGDTAIIGAPYDDDTAMSTGSVYVFDRVGGVFAQTQKLHAADETAGDEMCFAPCHIELLQFPRLLLRRHPRGVSMTRYDIVEQWRVMASHINTLGMCYG